MSAILERPRFEDPVTYMGSSLGFDTAIAIPETDIEQEAQQQKAEFLGKVAVSGVAEFKTEETSYGSLYDGIEAAYDKDPKAYNMVRSNVKTDAIERTFKAGHITEVRVEAAPDGSSSQHGQHMDAVHASTLLFASKLPKMKPRTDAEIANHFRTKGAYEDGLMKDHSMLVVSCVSDDMTEQERKDAKFFTDTMSISLQLTTAQGTELVTEVAFVAGVAEPGGERHDVPAVVALFREWLGVDISGKNVAEILNTPVLIRNQHIPNGITDVVERLDDKIEEVKNDGTKSFFGITRPREDYVAYREKCREREEVFDPKVDLITDELISQAPYITDEADACRLLNVLSGKHMIEQALFDASINPKVFGNVSAEAIYQARRAFEIGDKSGALHYINKAKAHDASVSCPGGLGETKDSDSSTDDESCTFVSKKCPKCGAKNVLTTVTATRIEGGCGCVASKK